ncbi:MAG: TPM domain-containing protein [Bilifractor sp.]
MRMEQRRKKAEGFLVSVMTCILAIVLLCVPVQADTNPAGAYVSDQEGLLSSDEVSSLEDAFRQFADSYDCSICFVSAGDQEIGENHDENDDQQYIETLAEQKFGKGADVISLLIDMDTRYYYVDVMGDVAQDIYPEAKQVKIRDAVEEQLKDGNYAEAPFTFVEKAEYWYNRDPKTDAYVRWAFISAGVAAVIVLIWFMIAASKHKEQHVASEADAYVQPDSFHLSVRQDTFLRSYVTRVAKPKENNSSHSSGGSSSGGGHSGGGGHF